MVWVDRFRRHVRLLLLFGAAITVLSVAGAAWVYEGDPPERRLSLDCFPFTPPTTVAGINKMVARYRATPGFTGADVRANAELQGGRGLWVFGDTLREPGFKGQKLVRNSMLMFSPGCATVVMPRDKGAVVPDRADGVGYWPMDVAVSGHDGYDLVGVSLQRVRTTGPGVFDFEVLGPSYALFKVPIGEAPQLLLVRDVGPDDPDTRRPMWGAAVEEDGGWIYLYGTATPSNQGCRAAYVFRLHRWWPHRELLCVRWPQGAGHLSVVQHAPIWIDRPDLQPAHPEGLRRQDLLPEPVSGQLGRDDQAHHEPVPLLARLVLEVPLLGRAGDDCGSVEVELRLRAASARRRDAGRAHLLRRQGMLNLAALVRSPT